MRRDERHVGALAEEMNGKDYPDLVAQPRLAFEPPIERGRVERVRPRIDVYESRACADAKNGADGGEERIGRGDHHIPWSDTEPRQRDQQRVGAGRHPDRIRDTEAFGHRVLERFYRRTADVVAGIDDVADRAFDLGPRRLKLRSQVEERDAHHVSRSTVSPSE